MWEGPPRIQIMITDLPRPASVAASALSRRRPASVRPPNASPPTRINSRRVIPSHSFVPRPRMLNIVGSCRQVGSVQEWSLRIVPCLEIQLELVVKLEKLGRFSDSPEVGWTDS